MTEYTTEHQRLIAARDAAYAAWKGTANRHAGEATQRFVEYIAANHALHRHEMPHLAALAPVWTNAPEPRQERPDAAEDHDYPFAPPF